MSGSKKIPQGQYLFREGDPPDAMYVLKSGKLAVTKTKQTSEIILAEIGPGAMVGEMAFFDNKARSASVKALKDTEVIALPYKALHAQFAQFPEWAKAIMRTVNDHLRAANARIKSMEKGGDEDVVFPPHTMTKLMAILGFVAFRYGEKISENEIIVPSGTLRNYTIQVFFEATNKMQKLMNILVEQGYLKIEDLGEGKQKLTVLNLKFIFQFTEWYNEWLFKKETDQITIKEEQVPILDGVLHFAKKSTRNDKGQVKLNLTQIQADSAAEVGLAIKSTDLEALVSLGFLSEKVMDGSNVTSIAQVEELEKIMPCWKLIYALKKVPKD